MKTRTWTFAWAVAIAGAVLLAPASIAQPEDDAESEDAVVDEIIVVGTRSAKPRSVTDSPVPIDVISGDDFNLVAGSADLTDNLKALVPSYTATPATGDGSAFVRPTSLRGTAPDQSLVLVNGKRRHRSALVQFFAPAAGNGAHGVDVGMIPGIAVKRVEVLRDGASSQYGSDAIAGVINFEMKDATDGTEVQLQYGQHFDNEDSFKFAVNTGFAVGDSGFINLSLEHIDNDALSRGVQRPDAQALIDLGVPGVGADAPFGDAPLAQTWGRPQTKGTRFFVNSGFDIGDNAQFYFTANYSDTEGRYRFFYRGGCEDITISPNTCHPTLQQLFDDQGFTGLPGGYTPYLDGDQKDIGVVAGVDGLFGNGMSYDFSVGYGSNELDYFLNNTTNPDLLLLPSGEPQRGFDVGAYEQEELNLNADFSKPIGDKLNLGFGAEWREETYHSIEGEPNSFFLSGANGLAGIGPTNSGSFDRDNIAVYVDLEHDVTDAFLVQYALRYEDFSDFGDTVNGKLAARYHVNDSFTLRGAVSTGFHAPTPGQTNVSTTITTFDGVTGLQIEELLVPSTSPLVAAVGGTALKEETSVNYSAGFFIQAGRRTAITFDLYQIEVQDRIYRTGDIAHPMPMNPSDTISFYTNALDVDHEGIDLVLTTGWNWSSSVDTDLSLAIGYNKIDVVGQTPVGGVNPVSASIIEDIENNYPNERFVLNTNTGLGEKWNIMFRANYYGKHFDERGTIGAAVDPSFEIGATLYFDLEARYDINDHVALAIGGINVTDEFVDTIGPPNANRLSVGLQYPRRSAANYEGGSWYVRSTFNF